MPPLTVEREISLPPHPVRQAIEDYIERCHSQASASRARQGQDGAAAYDAALRDLLRLHTNAGCLDYEVVVTISVGDPR